MATKRKKATKKPAGGRRSGFGDARVIAFVSEEEFFLSDGVARVERELFPKGGGVASVSEANLKPKPGEDAVELHELLDDLRTGSLFGSGKLVLVRGAESLSGEPREALLRTLEHLPAGVVCVLLMRKLRKGSKLEKLVERVGVIERTKPMYDRPGPWQRGAAPHDHEAGRWVVGRAKARGLTISPENAHLLVQRTGNHPGRLDSELEKLEVYLGEGQEVTSREIEALTPDVQEYRAFDLADAILAGERSRALAILDAILQEGMVGTDSSRLTFPAAIGGILVGALRSKLSQLLRVRRQLDAGRPPADVFAEAKVPPFLRETVAMQARSRSEPELRAALSYLLEFDLELKGGSGFPEATLLRLVLKISGSERRAS